MDDQLEELLDTFAHHIAYILQARKLTDYQLAQVKGLIPRSSLRGYLSEDTRRLDWLESLGVQSVYLNEHPHQLNPASQSLRASIDNAINGRPQ